MAAETDNLHKKIASQHKEIINLRGSYLIVRDQLDASLRQLKVAIDHVAENARRIATDAEQTSALVENAVSVAAEVEHRSELDRQKAWLIAAEARKEVAVAASTRLAEVVKSAIELEESLVRSAIKLEELSPVVEREHARAHA